MEGQTAKLSTPQQKIRNSLVDILQRAFDNLKGKWTHHQLFVSNNYALTRNRYSGERDWRVGGCLSSYSYYENIPEQITSIVVSLLKGHFSQDGNKRTALAIYLDLCQNNDIEFLSDQDRLGEVSIDIAATQRDIAENARLLFPDWKKKYLLEFGLFTVQSAKK